MVLEGARGRLKDIAGGLNEAGAGMMRRAGRHVSARCRNAAILWNIKGDCGYFDDMKSGIRPGEAGILPTRASLLRRLKNWRDDSSWDDFARTYSRFLRGLALKAGLGEADADDVVQETMLAVARKMPGFNYDPALGSFKGWLALIARRRIADHLRKKHYQCGEARLAREERLGTTLAERRAGSDGFPLERRWQEEWSRSVFDVASAKVKERVRALDYQMFYLHIVKQCPVPEVSKRLGVKRAQVYVAKYKIGAMLRREIKRLDRQLF